MKKKLIFAHVEDDEACSQLLEAHLRRSLGDGIDFTWIACKPASMNVFSACDVIILDGHIPGWDNHIIEVENFNKRSILFIWSACAQKCSKYSQMGFKCYLKSGDLAPLCGAILDAVSEETMLT